MGRKKLYEPLAALIVLAATAAAQQSGSRGPSEVPPGHRPPAGMCRVWIDGVPPGKQPAVTDCVTAVATRPANGRVIYGDNAAFPGQGKGKATERSSDGRVIPWPVSDDSARPQQGRRQGQGQGRGKKP